MAQNNVDHNNSTSTKQASRSPAIGRPSKNTNVIISSSDNDEFQSDNNKSDSNSDKPANGRLDRKADGNIVLDEESSPLLSPDRLPDFKSSQIGNNSVVESTTNQSKPVRNLYENPIGNHVGLQRLIQEKEVLQNVLKQVAGEEKPVLRVQFDKISPDSNNVKIKNEEAARTRTISSSSSSSESSSSSDSEFDISEVKPPDGGYGWVIVAACFMVNLIADGITFSFGVIIMDLVEYWEASRGEVAWMGSLFMSMPLLSGPLASFLTDRYGCRAVTIAGAVTASIGFILSAFANSLVVLYLVFGILSGFGLSLCYVASVVIVAYYFDKRRSLATGLAVCGSGIGTTLFAKLLRYLADVYTWRGATLITAGFLLNLAVCGALMRELPWTSKNKKRLARERKKNRDCKRRNKGGSSVDTFSVSNASCTPSVLQPILETKDESNDQNNPDRLCSSLVNLPTFIGNGERVPVEVLELLSTHKNMYNVLMANYPSLVPSRSFSESARLNELHLNKSLNETPLVSPTSGESTSVKKRFSPPKPYQKKVPPAFLRDLRIHRLSVTYRGAMLNINRYRLRASSCPDIYRNSMTTIAKEKTQWYDGFYDLWDVMVDMFDFSYFADIKYLLFAISNFLLYMWYDVPYVYLTDNAVRLGYSESDASTLVATMGFINMVGEIFLGWLGDRPWINVGVVYAICMALCGAVAAFVPLVYDFGLLCSLSGAYGFFIAANYSLTCIILVELITLDKFTNAYGLLLLVQGVGNLIGPPLGGWLFDITGDYALSFYLAGFFIAGSSLLLLILPIAKHYRRFMSRHASSEASIRVEAGAVKVNSFANDLGKPKDKSNA